MAVYKVPQDVEADDKLIGPFSFRQFIYLIIVAGAGFIGWLLAQLFFPLFVLMLPIIIFFGALALPLRKDQPMETYMAAIVSFYLKPRRRLWSPDGTQTLVEITVPKVIEVKRTKDLSETEAEQRLSYLAQIVDSRGWAVRGVQTPMPASPGAMTNDAFLEAQATPDMLDESTGVGQALDARLDQADAKRHQEMIDRMRGQATTAPPVAAAPAIQVADPYAALQAPSTPVTPAPVNDEPDPNVAFNPYPAMHQSIVDPNGPHQSHPAAPAPGSEKPGEKPVSPDIINLANNPDLSVETIAREANRIHEKEKLSEDEVVISLR